MLAGLRTFPALLGGAQAQDLSPVLSLHFVPEARLLPRRSAVCLHVRGEELDSGASGVLSEVRACPWQRAWQAPGPRSQGCGSPGQTSGTWQSGF